MPKCINFGGSVLTLRFSQNKTQAMTKPSQPYFSNELLCLAGVKGRGDAAQNKTPDLSI